MHQFDRKIHFYRNRLFLILLLSLPKLNFKEGTQLFLTSGFCLFTWLFLPSEAKAQILPDATLPVNSIVTPQGNTNVIEGGTRAGGNLFHSFREFSVPTGTEAFFNNGVDVQNIFSRVTGKSISNIDGLIRANGTANLFLLNPNGIIFGPNAKLNIGGSFLGSTANSIRFADGIEFSATNPQTTSLLTINVPIGLQYGSNPQEIRIQGKGQESGFATTKFDSSFNPLEVLPGKSLTIVGGNVILDGGIVQAPGGRVEIGAVGGAGTVGLNADGSLTFPDASKGETPIPRADVFILNKSGINVLAGGGGSISITSRNLDISGDSLLTAGIAQGEGSVDSIAGDIQLNISAATILDSSRIENILNPKAIGNSGNIIINTGSLSVTNNAQLSTSTFAQGNTGNITIAANDFVSFTNGAQLDANTYGIGDAGQVNIKSNTVSFDGNNTGAFSDVKANAEGNGGRISITANSLSVTNGAQLDTSTFSKGNAGQVNINSDTVIFDGKNTTVFSSVSENGVGNAGGISIKAKSLSVSNNAELGTTTLGIGNAGKIIIESDTVSFNSGAGAYSNVGATEKTAGVGKAGGIEITANSLSVTNGAQLATSTFGKGNAGIILIKSDAVSFDGAAGAFSNVGSADYPLAEGDAGGIEITANSLSVTNGAQLDTSTFSKGNAGKIIINSNTVSFEGKNSAAFSSVAETGVGNAGGIEITANSLFVKNGALLGTSTVGLGDAGQIIIKSDIVSFDGNSSGAFSTVAATEEKIGQGNAGGISIIAKSLSLTNGALLTANTFGIGNAGEITIDSDTVSFNGADTGVFSDVKETAVGNAGNIFITGKSVSVINGALLGSSTFGKGNAGVILINSDIVSFDGDRSGAYSTVEGTGEGDAIGIGIIAKYLSVTNGALLGSSTFGKGNAGQIVIQSENVSFAGTNSGAYSTVGATKNSTGVGNAGGIDITAESVSVINGAQLTASTFGIGNAGQVTIKSDTVSFDGSDSGAFSDVYEQAKGNAGGIDITANSLSVTNSARLRTSTFGKGNAGIILIQGGKISFDGKQSGAYSNVEPKSEGNAGNIGITATFLSLTNGAQLGTSTFSKGDAGQIFIQSDSVFFDGSKTAAFSSVAEQGQGDAGGIEILANSLFVTNNAQIGASTFGIGNAGQIIIKSDTVFFDGSGTGAFSDVNQKAIGNAGGIEITAKSVSLTNGALLGTSTFSEGNAGIILIESETISFDGNKSGAYSTVEENGEGNAGGIGIIAKSLSVTNGAQLTASIFGKGNAGTILINSDMVSFDGNKSGAFSNVDRSENTNVVGEGNAGGIEITANSLSVSNGALLTASTLGIGNAGEIIINSDNIFFDGNSYAFSSVADTGVGNAGGIFVTTKSLSFTNGAQLTTSTVGIGNAGSIVINGGAVSFDGKGSFYSGAFSSVEKNGVGNAGGIDITANSLSLTNGAVLSTKSVGNGNKAGLIKVNANSIRLSQQGSIFSDTEGGEGNINLQADALILRRNSSITTNSKGSNNIGGNITINTDVLAALENSKIQANSEDFRGGRVVIITQGIFLSADSQISATGAGGNPELSGTVEIITPNVDPGAGLINLPENVVDSTKLVASSCRRNSDESSTFVVTGRGGLPSSPNEPLLNEATWVDLRPIEQKSSNVQAQSIPNIDREESNESATTKEQIVEAQGWLVNGKGEVVLVAQTPTVTPSNSKFSIQYCHDP